MSPKADVEGNLRGRAVEFQIGGKRIIGEVITRTRGTRWMIALRRPYRHTRRMVLDRSQFNVKDDAATQGDLHRD